MLQFHPASREPFMIAGVGWQCLRHLCHHKQCGMTQLAWKCTDEVSYHGIVRSSSDEVVNLG
jgi:hypothetical protein